MKPIRAVVADDEPLARARLIRLLVETDRVSIVGEAADGSQAMSLCASQKPEVIFLDIDMPGLDGLGVAERLIDVGVVFVTAHRTHAAEAFDVRAWDYLLKPISRERLVRSLDVVRDRLGSQGTGKATEDFGWRITLNKAQGISWVDARQVERFYAHEKYTHFVHGEMTEMIEESLDALEERLSPHGFVRLHRAELVRKDAIVSLRKESDGTVFAVCRSGAEAGIARRKIAAIKRMLM